MERIVSRQGLNSDGSLGLEHNVDGASAKVRGGAKVHLTLPKAILQYKSKSYKQKGATHMTTYDPSTQTNGYSICSLAVCNVLRVELNMLELPPDSTS